MELTNKVSAIFHMIYLSINTNMQSTFDVVKHNNKFWE